MTDPMTDADLDAIEQRFAEGRVVNIAAQHQLLAEVRRLRADAVQIRAWTKQIAAHFGDEWPHEGGCMGDPSDSGCPLCRILAALDGEQ